MGQSIGDDQIRGIERAAVDLARGAGGILAARFGGRVEVEFKDRQQRDPVTAADRAAQAFLAGEIARRFPGHGILGEEATEAERQSEELARDVLWVLDPLDGTTNFLNGLPVFASSIGVLYRGWPVAAALYVPWPGAGGGFVLHCRRGGGAGVLPALAGGGAGDDAGAAAARVLEAERPIPNRLVGLPGYFGAANRFAGGLEGKAGEPRTTGSIAYELAMTARGVMQYAIFGAPRLWDAAGGALAVLEAGGAVMVRFRGDRRWRPLDSLVPSWEERTPTMKELRAWMAPMVAGNRHLAPLIANNVRRRFSLRGRVRALGRGLAKNRGKSRR